MNDLRVRHRSWNHLRGGMKKATLMVAAGFLVIIVIASFRSHAQDASARNQLLGKWTNQNETKGPAIINVTAIDPVTGRLSGKYYPPSGAAAGKEFDITGWASSAPVAANRDNVVVVSFSVSLSTYGSIASWTGFLKDNKIVASSYNVRSNSGYEWDHITATYDVWTKNP